MRLLSLAVVLGVTLLFPVSLIALLSLTRLGYGFRRFVDDFVQLSTVQPNTAAIRTVVNLDSLTL